MDYLILKKGCSIALWLYYSLSSSERDGMIKQRTRWYLCLLLTCDLRCATFTLKYNADSFFLYCVCFVFDHQVHNSEDSWHFSTFLWIYFTKYNISRFIYLTQQVFFWHKLLCCSVLLLAPGDSRGNKRRICSVKKFRMNGVSTACGIMKISYCAAGHRLHY